MMTWVHPTSQQHAGADFAGVGALFFPVHVLGADRDIRALGSLDRAAEVNERRADNDFVASRGRRPGEESRGRSRGSGRAFLYIFQLAAMTFFLKEYSSRSLAGIGRQTFATSRKLARRR